MLTAFVSVNARFDVDSVGIRRLVGWNATVFKTRAVVHKLPPRKSDDFHVRLSVRIHSVSPSVQKKPEVSLRQIAVAVSGASFGYILLGLLLLRIFQQMYLLSNLFAWFMSHDSIRGYAMTKYVTTTTDAAKVTPQPHG